MILALVISSVLSHVWVCVGACGCGGVGWVDGWWVVGWMGGSRARTPIWLLFTCLDKHVQTNLVRCSMTLVLLCCMKQAKLSLLLTHTVAGLTWLVSKLEETDGRLTESLPQP